MYFKLQVIKSDNTEEQKIVEADSSAQALEIVKLEYIGAKRIVLTSTNTPPASL